MKDPQTLPRPRVEPADEALSLFRLFGAPPGRCAAPTIDDVLVATTGVACRPTSPVIGVDRLIVVQLQIDDAARCRSREPDAGLGIERDEPGSRASRRESGVLLASRSNTASPRPESCRGADRHRAGPRRSLCIHSSSPVAASSATTRARACRLSSTDTPLTISGVDLQVRILGAGPRSSVLNRHATSSLLKLSLRDLVEGRIAGVGQVATVGGPFAVPRPGLAANRQGRPGQHNSENDGRRRRGTQHYPHHRLAPWLA